MGATRKLVIRSLSELATGTGERGPWTLYAVTAETADGHAIGEKLTTFDNRLPLNELVDLEITSRDHPEYGRSYLLRRPRASRLRGAALAGRVADLEKRMNAVEAHLRPRLPV